MRIEKLGPRLSRRRQPFNAAPPAVHNAQPRWGKAVGTGGGGWRKLLLRGEFAHYAAGQFAAKLIDSLRALWVKTGIGRGGGVGAIARRNSAAPSVPPPESSQFPRRALLLLNAAVPYWHAAQKLQAWTSAYADPEARHESLPSVALECHQPEWRRPGTARRQPGPRQQAALSAMPGVATLFARHRPSGNSLYPLRSACHRGFAPAPGRAEGRRIRGAGPAACATFSLRSGSANSAAARCGFAVRASS